MADSTKRLPDYPSTGEASPAIRHPPSAIRHSPLLTATIWLAILTYIALFSYLSIHEHMALRTHARDLGNMDQPIWNTLHGRLLVDTRDGFQATRLTDHVEPIFILIAPVFLIWDDVRALLILQTVVIALAAWPVYLLARDLFIAHPPSPRSQIRNPKSEIRNLLPANRYLLTAAFPLAYLLAPAVEAANMAEFHAAPLATLPIALAFWFLHRRRARAFALAALTVAMVKEEMALMAALLGLYAMVGAWSPFAIRHSQSQIRNPKSEIRNLLPATRYPLTALLFLSGLLVTLLSLTWFGLATFVIVPHYARAVYGVRESIYFQRYGELGNSSFDILKAILTQPQTVWAIATRPARLRYLLGLLTSGGLLLPLLAPEVLLLTAPLLLANLLSAFWFQFSGEFHYSAPLVPYIIVAAIHGTHRLLRFLTPFTSTGEASHRPMFTPARTPTPKPTPTLQAQIRNPQSAIRNLLTANRYLLTAILLITVLSYHYLEGWTPLGREFRYTPITPHARLAQRFIAQVPPDVPLTTTPALFPHLSHREVIYQFPTVADATYALVDVAGTTDRPPGDIRQAVMDLLNADWGVLDAADGYLLLAKGQGVKTIPDPFYDFIRAPNPTPQFSARVRFNDRLLYLGFDLEEDPKWRWVRFTHYFRPLQPLPPGTLVHPFAVTPDGRVRLDPAQLPPTEPYWLPPEQWEPGQTYVVRTYNQATVWDDVLAPAVGVSTGSWEDPTRYWEPTVLGPTDAALSANRTWVRLNPFHRQGRRLRPGLGDFDRVTSREVAWQGGIRLTGARAPERVRQGERLTFVLRWQVETRVPLDYAVFVHLRDGSGQTLLVGDAQPAWWEMLPMPRWSPGRPVLDAHSLEVPEDLPVGVYTLVIGLYDWRTGDRLPLVGGDTEVVLGKVQVGGLVEWTGW